MRPPGGSRSDPRSTSLARRSAPRRPRRSRRLGGHPDGELPVGLIEMGDTTAGLDGGDVDPRNVDVLLDRDLGLRKRLIGGGLVARFPMPDVIVGLPFLVGT